MLIFSDSLPGFKGLLSGLAVPWHFLGHIFCFVGAFILHRGTMSCSQAANLFPQRRRHVATLTRFLMDIRHAKDLLACVRSATLIIDAEYARGGEWLFIPDGTKRHSQGELENSWSCGNTKRTPRKQRKGKGKRKQYKNKSSRCHGFVGGLLLTPGGVRLPYYRPYYTREYCELTERPFYTDSELAAQMIRALELPPGAVLVVVGDTAYDAEVIQDACEERDCLWVVPANPERVLAGQPRGYRLTAAALAALRRAKVPAKLLAKLVDLTEKFASRRAFEAALSQRLSAEEWQKYRPLLLQHGKAKRRQVRELTQELSHRSFHPICLSLDEEPYRLQRRVSASRARSKKPPQRTFWVHRRTADVHSVGEVVLLFSNKQCVRSDAGKREVDKLLMSNALEASTEQLLVWYDLRWQIELFFKECKSVLGLDHYRLKKFQQVEGWVELCLTSFAYLEWYRATQLQRDDLSAKERQRWERMRTHDLCEQVRLRLEQEEVETMCTMMESAAGRRELAAALRAACAANQEETVAA